MHLARIRIGSLAFLAALAVTLALSAPAGATPSKPFSLVICALGSSENCAPTPTSSANAPAAVPSGGRSVAMTATFTNENKPTSGIRLGSVNLTPPSGFVVSLAPPQPPCPGCTATVVGNVVQLRSLGLPPGGSVTVSMAVDDHLAAGCVAPNLVPGPTNSPTCAWSTEVKQSNDFSGAPGNDLTFDPAASAPYTVLAHLAFGSEPGSADVGQVISDSDFTPPGPGASAVSTKVLDANATKVGSYVGEVHLTLNQGTTPQGGTVAGGTSGASATAVAGTATFPNLEVTAPGGGYTFTGSATDLPPTTNSTSFNIAQSGETCATKKPCNSITASTSDVASAGGIKATALTDATSNSAQVDLIESTDFGTPLTANQCEGYQATHDAFFDVPGNTDRTTTASITTTQLSGNVSGSMINGQDDCLETVGVGHDFLEIIDGTNNTQLAPQTGTTASGDPIFTGLLPDCGTRPGQVNPSIWPCVQSRSGQSSKFGNGMLTITISVPAGFGDPTHSG